MARFLKSAVAIAAVAVAATNAAPLARRDLCPNGFQDLYAITGVVSSLAVSPQRDCHAQDGLNIRNGYEVSTDVSTHVRWRWAGRGAAGAVRARRPVRTQLSENMNANSRGSSPSSSSARGVARLTFSLESDERARRLQTSRIPKP